MSGKKSAIIATSRNAAVRCIRSAIALALALVLACSMSFAAERVQVSNAWVRATVPGQAVAAAYLDIRAPHAAVLVEVSSPVARKVELHTMTMEAGVMKMRPLEKLELPAQRTVSLKPGGYHLMLTDVRSQLKAGTKVPLVLSVQDAAGKKSTIEISAEVRSTGGGHAAH